MRNYLLLGIFFALQLLYLCTLTRACTKDSKTFCTPLLAESSSCEQYIRHNNYAYVPLQGISVRKYKYMGI